MKTADIRLSMPEPQANLFALWIKRIGWDEIRQNAKDEAEAYAMKEAILTVERAFNDAGFAPR